MLPKPDIYSKQVSNHHLIHRVRIAIRREHLLPSATQPIVVGFSAGADSCALLLALHLLGYRVVAAHFNFHLRGEESNRDQLHAQELCRQWGIPLEEREADTIAYARQKGVSIEVAARNLRYCFFEELYHKYRAQAVAVAHHLEDNIETMLQHIARGAGIAGLRGMLYKRDYIVRPLLEVELRHIHHFLQIAQVNFCTDQTNWDTTIERNYVRHQIRPLFDKLNPSFDQSAKRLLQHLRESEQIQEQYIASQLPTIYQENQIHLPPLLQSAAPLTLLHHIISPLGFTREQEGNILLVAADPQKQALFETHQCRAVKEGNTLYLLKSPTLRLLPLEISLQRKHLTQIPQTELPIRWTLTVQLPHSISLGKRAVALDYEALIQQGHTKLFWQPVDLQDSFSPYGMPHGSKKVGKMLREAKRTPVEREQQMGLYTEEGVLLWLPHIATAHHFVLTSSTKEILLFQLK